jgi:glyoxalase family protein
MQPSILGLHHVTATVDQAQPDLDFCIDSLGLRLVKKTVNFDNHHVYHFYYGDERGRPGTIWTTFPYHGHGVPVGEKGAGQITMTSFSVPAGSLAAWKQRFQSRGIAVRDEEPRFNEESIAVTDPSGLNFELIATRRDTRAPWTAGGVDDTLAIRGLHSVTMTIAQPAETIAFMQQHLGWRVAGEIKGRTRMAVNGDEPGKTIDVVHAPDAPPARNGLGTVHHVAMAIGSDEEQLDMRERLGAGARVTEVRDRQYFKSIYFREPGGVLFEVATLAPGFDVDEPLAALGRDLKLPPWEEPHRPMIEAGLARVSYRSCCSLMPASPWCRRGPRSARAAASSSWCTAATPRPRTFSTWCRGWLGRTSPTWRPRRRTTRGIRFHSLQKPRRTSRACRRHCRCSPRW